MDQLYDSRLSGATGTLPFPLLFSSSLKSLIAVRQLIGEMSLLFDFKSYERAELGIQWMFLQSYSLELRKIFLNLVLKFDQQKLLLAKSLASNQLFERLFLLIEKLNDSAVKANYCLP